MSLWKPSTLTGMFTNLSIGAKLSFLIVVNSSVALVLAGFALFGYESFLQRAAASRELSAQAGIIAESSTAVLSFSDEQAAAQTLTALRGDSAVTEGVIYDSNRRPFARYRRAGSTDRASAPAVREPGVFFENDAVLVFQPIRVGNQTIGTIFLKSNNDVHARLRQYIGIVCLVLLLSQGLALLLSSRLQRTIALPIAELTAVARSISVNRNYAARAVGRPGGEIGSLIDSFNHMLLQIDSREQALCESEERYALATRGANDGLWDWKFATDEIYFSARWSQMLGYADHDRRSDSKEWLRLIHHADRDRVQADIAAHREGRSPIFNCEYRMHHQNGSFVWVLSRGIAVRNGEGIATRMAGSQTDITEGKVADPLTALPNRLHLMEKLESSFDAAQRNGSQFAVLFLDLDRFKLVNDSLGHAAGDELLIGIAGRLRSGVRSGWVSRQSVVARLGGDEFAILLGDIRDERDPAGVAQRILDELKTPFCLEGRQVFASVSIGIALSSSCDNSEDLLRNADTAMYQAKVQNRACFAVFDKGMRERAIARLEVETGLRRAIDEHQLVLYYQPELSVSTRRVKGYEALVRWNHPQSGIRPPSEFIPIAEESDLIVHLGRWVLNEACRQMAEWQKKFVSDPPLTISVNISARHLNDVGLVQDVEHALAGSGLDPKCLKLEVTEGAVMQNPEAAQATLRRLKHMNIGLELDDFGTGYSSLSHLQRLPFDTVKIDRSFVTELGGGPENSEIVKAIVDLARSLEMQVVAEGVETEEQLEKLTALGCDYVQGFYFSKPIGAMPTNTAMQENDDMRRAFAALRGEGEAIPAPQTEEILV